MASVGSLCFHLVRYLDHLGILHNTDHRHTELTAAGITIAYWNDTINVGVWVTVFFVLLVLIQFFGVRGYGEGE